MRKKKKIILIIAGVVAGVLLVGGIYLAVTQQQNIKAVQVAVSTTTDDINAMVEAQSEKIADVVSKFPEEFSITQESIDEAVQAKKDALEQEEAITDTAEATVTTTDTAETAATTQSTESTSVDTTSVTATTTVTEPEKELTEAELAAIEVTELTAELYMQKDYYIGLLDALEQQGLAEVSALTSEERKSDKLLTLALQYFNAASQLERDADDVVIGLIAEIEIILLEFGGDTSLCDEIFEAYTDEKTLKKAQYMSKYADYVSEVMG